MYTKNLILQTWQNPRSIYQTKQTKKINKPNQNVYGHVSPPKDNDYTHTHPPTHPNNQPSQVLCIFVMRRLQMSSVISHSCRILKSPFRCFNVESHENRIRRGKRVGGDNNAVQIECPPPPKSLPLRDTLIQTVLMKYTISFCGSTVMAKSLIAEVKSILLYLFQFQYNSIRNICTLNT